MRWPVNLVLGGVDVCEGRTGIFCKMAEVRGRNFPEPEEYPVDPAIPGMPLKTFAFNDSGIAFCAGRFGDKSRLFCAYLGVDLLGKIASAATVGEEERDATWFPVECKSKDNTESFPVEHVRHMSFNATGTALAVCMEDTFLTLVVDNQLHKWLLVQDVAAEPTPITFLASMPVRRRLHRLLHAEWHPLHSDVFAVLWKNGAYPCRSLFVLYSVGAEGDDLWEDRQSTTILDSDDELTSFTFVQHSNGLDNWELFTVYFLLKEGSVRPVCPCVPRGTQIERGTWLGLMSQAKEDEDGRAQGWLESAWETRGAGEGSGDIMEYLGSDLKPATGRPALQVREESSQAHVEEDAISCKAINMCQEDTVWDVPTVFVMSYLSGNVDVLVSLNPVPGPVFDLERTPGRAQSGLHRLQRLKCGSEEDGHDPHLYLVHDVGATDQLFLVGSRAAYTLVLPWLHHLREYFHDGQTQDAPPPDFQQWREQIVISCVVHEETELLGFQSSVYLSKRRTLARTRSALRSFMVSTAKKRVSAVNVDEDSSEDFLDAKYRFDKTILETGRSCKHISPTPWKVPQNMESETSRKAVLEAVTKMTMRVGELLTFQKEMQRVSALWHGEVNDLLQMYTSRLNEKLPPLFKRLKEPNGGLEGRIARLSNKRKQLETRFDAIVRKIHMFRPLSEEEKQWSSELKKQDQELHQASRALPMLEKEWEAIQRKLGEAPKQMPVHLPERMKRELLAAISEHHNTLERCSNILQTIDEAGFERMVALSALPTSGAAAVAAAKAEY